jgi:hypothetical protein
MAASKGEKVIGIIYHLGGLGKICVLVISWCGLPHQDQWHEYLTESLQADRGLTCSPRADTILFRFSPSWLAS